MVDSMGERGEPCGIPTPASGIGSHRWLSTRTIVLRSARKERSHATSSGEKPKSSIVCTRRAWFTWSKYPLMSMASADRVSLRRHATSMS
ncbi:hypothetical protein HDZ31DRAFT_50389 [Schizophyllum fasciatum]